MSTVTNYQFGIGDAVSTAFTIMDPSGFAAINPVVSALSRTDWQGTVVLSPNPRTNYLLQSEDFYSASWFKTRASVTPSQPGPDGLNTAWLLTEDTTASNSHLLSQFPANPPDNTIVSIGFWAKPSATRGVQIQFRLHTGVYPLVRWTTTGTTYENKGAEIAVASATPHPTIPGFNYYAATVNVGAGATPFGVYIGLTGASGVTVYTGDGVSSIVVGKPMLDYTGGEIGSYIPTTTAAVTMTDYTLAGSVATLAEAPVDRALLSWSGTDDNGPFIPNHVYQINTAGVR